MTAQSPTPAMTLAETAQKLTRASQKFFYDVTTKLAWPESLDPTQWAMAPELISLYGTPVWDALSEEQQKKLAFHETAGFLNQ